MPGGRPGSLTDEQVRVIRADYPDLMNRLGRPAAVRILMKREGCSKWQVLAVVYYKTYQRVE